MSGRWEDREAAAERTGTDNLRPPQTTGAFWQTWKDFEVRHGNEDTIREMLRIRRSVQATYNTQVNFMASQMLKVSGSATGTGEQPRPPRALPGLPWGDTAPGLGSCESCLCFCPALTSWVWEHQGPSLPPLSESGTHGGLGPQG